MEHRATLSDLIRQGASVPHAVATLGAGLLGLGVVFWVAAHWAQWGRLAQFALLQGAWLALCLGAAQRPAWRTPLALVAFLVLGGMLAYFGQTYQTGADPWSLFATWALLGLPLCLAVRRDGLWAGWALVALTGVSLWWQTWQGPMWRLASDAGPMAIASGVAVAISLAVHPALLPGWARWLGTGRWAWLTALLLTLVLMGTGAVLAMMGQNWVGPWALSLGLLAMLVVVTLRVRPRDVAALSAQALLANVLLIGALARLLFEGAHGGEIGLFLLLGLAAMGLLAATVSWILRWARADGLDSAARAVSGGAA